MFERYTEKARQMIVRAKHEADRFGSREIGVEHTLLALLNDAVLIRNTMEGVSENELRDAINARLPGGETMPLPHDLPLSGESRQALVLAAEEADGLSHRHIRNEHLLLGLMQCENSYAAELLKQKGLSTDKLRAQIAALVPKNEAQEGSVSKSPGNLRTAEESPAEAEQKHQFSETIRRVGELVRRGEGQNALRLLDDFMGEPKQDRELRVRLMGQFAAITASSIGDLKTARRYCEEVVAHNPDDPRALYSLADCLAKQGETNEASRYAVASTLR